MIVRVSDRRSVQLKLEMEKEGKTFNELVSYYIEEELKKHKDGKLDILDCLECGRPLTVLIRPYEGKHLCTIRCRKCGFSLSAVHRSREGAYRTLMLKHGL